MTNKKSEPLTDETAEEKIETAIERSYAKEMVKPEQFAEIEQAYDLSANKTSREP